MHKIPQQKPQRVTEIHGSKPREENRGMTKNTDQAVVGSINFEAKKNNHATTTKIY